MMTKLVTDEQKEMREKGGIEQGVARPDILAVARLHPVRYKFPKLAKQ